MEPERARDSSNTALSKIYISPWILELSTLQKMNTPLYDHYNTQCNGALWNPLPTSFSPSRVLPLGPAPQARQGRRVRHGMMGWVPGPPRFANWFTESYLILVFLCVLFGVRAF